MTILKTPEQTNFKIKKKKKFQTCISYTKRKYDIKIQMTESLQFRYHPGKGQLMPILSGREGNCTEHIVILWLSRLKFLTVEEEKPKTTSYAACYFKKYPKIKAATYQVNVAQYVKHIYH